MSLRGEYVKITKTEPTEKSTLPLIFDKVNDAAVFKYQFGGPLKRDSNMLALKLEYITCKVFEHLKDFDKHRIGSFNVKTTLTITSQHNSYEIFQIFHACIEGEINDFKTRFSKLKLINYPIDKIIIPSFEEVYPILCELYGNPDGDMGRQAQ